MAKTCHQCVHPLGQRRGRQQRRPGRRAVSLRGTSLGSKPVQLGPSTQLRPMDLCVPV